MSEVSVDYLSKIFKSDEGPTFLNVIDSKDVNSSTHTVEIEMRIPKDLRWFDGHFPGTPVLPGIAQVNWVGTLAKAIFVDLGSFKRLTNIKFKTMIMPGTHLSMSISHKLDKTGEKQQIKFSYFDEQDVFSTGTFSF